MQRAARTSGNVSYSRQRPSAAVDHQQLPVRVIVAAAAGRAGVTGIYALSWDIGRGYVVSQTMAWSYMAQCCGFQAEFQKFNYPDSSGRPVPSDRRFNFSFVLAGLGSFSNFFGAFGGR